MDVWGKWVRSGNVKSLFIKDIPPELGRRLKAASIEGGVSMREMVLVAVGEYLDFRAKKPVMMGVKVNQEREMGNIIVGEGEELIIDMDLRRHGVGFNNAGPKADEVPKGFKKTW
ncbi:MAG: hypothetical protein A2W23_06240 [Planctomycetes bacterium RBG_16_43_13]|nr:MAG: hypothetical protein A2W23_06240 [Planctomycetes bacterium RBG_16_43_13]